MEALMGLGHKIRRSQVLLGRLTPAEHRFLEQGCRTIQSAQAHLNSSCAEAFQACLAGCRGKCCRNIHADSIVTQLDMVFIAASDHSMPSRMLLRAGQESLFTADCPFLNDGVGPCMFAADQKPEQCVITFCTPVTALRKPVRQVRSAFTRLWWRVFLLRPLFWFSWQYVDGPSPEILGAAACRTESKGVSPRPPSP